MHKATKLPMLNVNQHVLCILCGGYLIDATTIIECLHSFCRSCIVRYLETSKYCPICDVQVHKTRPLLNIRSDKTLQDLVYKLVPGLFKNEMLRRKEFYASNIEPDEIMARLSKEEKGELDEKSVITEDEKISVCIEHTARLPPFKNGSSTNFPERQAVDYRENRRFLLVPAGFTVGLLKKFIFLKYDLGPNFRIGIIHSDEVLSDEFTLMDIAYIYGWRRLEPLKLYYIVVDKMLLNPQPLPEVEDAPLESPSRASESTAVSTLVAVPPVGTEQGTYTKEEDTASQGTSEYVMDLSVGKTEESKIPTSGAKVEGASEIPVACASSEDEDNGDFGFGGMDSDPSTPVPQEDSAMSDNSLAKIVVITPDRPINDNSHTNLKEQAMANASNVAKGEVAQVTEGKGKETANVIPKNKRPKAKSSDDPTADPQLQDAINKVLEVLSEDSSEKENQSTDDEQATTYTKVDKEDIMEKKDTNASNGESNQCDAKKLNAVNNNNVASDSGKEFSSSDEVPRLVIIEPERSDSVHSDKENQAVLASSTITKQSSVPSHPIQEPMDTQSSNEQSDAPQVPLPVYTVQPLSSTNSESKMVCSNGTTKVVTATAEDKQPTPSRPQNNDGKKRPESFAETVIKRKRGRPPKIPKDPSQSTPPKIARILPKGLPPHTGFVQPPPGGMASMMNMMGPQMVTMPFNGTNGMANGQMVFVQNMGGQQGQMMVQQAQPMANNGMNPQGMNNQMAMNCVNQGMAPNMQQTAGNQQINTNQPMNNVQVMNTQNLPSSQAQHGMLANTTIASGQMANQPMMANQSIPNNQMAMNQSHLSMFNQQMAGNPHLINANLPMASGNPHAIRGNQPMIRGNQPVTSLAHQIVPGSQHMMAGNHPMNAPMNAPPRMGAPQANPQTVSQGQQPLPPMRMPPPTSHPTYSSGHMRLPNPISAPKVFQQQQQQQLPPSSIVTSSSQNLNNGYDAPLELTTKRSTAHNSSQGSVNVPGMLKVPAPPLQQPMPS